MIQLGFYFDRYRNLAYGIASSGVGIGIMILAPITNYLIEQYTWRGTCIIFAGLQLNYFAFAYLIDPFTCDSASDNKTDSSSDYCGIEMNYLLEIKQNDKGACKHNVGTRALKHHFDSNINGAQYHSLQELCSRNKIVISIRNLSKYSFSANDMQSKPIRNVGETLYQQNDTYSHSSSDTISDQIVSDESKATVDLTSKVTSHEAISTFVNILTIFRNIKYDLFCCNLIFVSSALGTIYNYLPAYSIAMGNTDTKVSFLVSVLGISNMSIRLLTGVITSTKCNSLLFYLVSLCVLGILFLLAPFYGKYYMGQITIAIIAGACNTTFAIMPQFVIRFAGLKSLDIGYGFAFVMTGFGFLFGPPLSGNI